MLVRRASRQPGDVLGTGEVRGETAEAEDGQQSLLLVTTCKPGTAAQAAYDT